MTTVTTVPNTTERFVVEKVTAGTIDLFDPRKGIKFKTKGWVVRDMAHGGRVVIRAPRKRECVADAKDLNAGNHTNQRDIERGQCWTYLKVSKP